MWIDVVRGCAAVNVVMLLALSVVWARNYREFRSKHTLGFLVFGVLLMAENAVALWVFGMDPLLSVWFSSEMPAAAGRSPMGPGNAMMVLRVLETGGLLFLAWVTWD